MGWFAVCAIIGLAASVAAAYKVGLARRHRRPQSVAKSTSYHSAASFPQKRPRRWALLVGVAPTDGLPCDDIHNEVLLSGELNCTKIRGLLISYGFADTDIVMLTSVNDTSKEAVMQQFHESTKGSHGPDDHFVFYVSAHGGYQHIGLDPGAGTFITDTNASNIEFDSDWDLDNPGDEFSVEEYVRERNPYVRAYATAVLDAEGATCVEEASAENCISLRELYGYGEPQQCHRTFIIDACLSGVQVPKQGNTPVFASNFFSALAYMTRLHL